MPDSNEISADTVARIADELVGIPVGGQELEALGALLGAIVSEMARMRAMKVADTEPATTYDPNQP